jgi:hypothetical protein
VVTTNPVKERMRIEVARLLRTNTIRFSDPFISSNPGTRDTICAQLREYRFEVREGDPNSGRGPKMFLTGKGFGKSDDLALALQILVFWATTYFADGERCLV